MWISNDCSVCLITMKLSGDGFKNKQKYLFTQWAIGECVVTGYHRRQKHKWVQKAICSINLAKCLVGVVVCIQPPAPYNTELDTEHPAGRNASLCSLCFSCFPPGAGGAGASTCSHPGSPSALINKRLTRTVLTHPSGLLSSSPPPFHPSRGDSMSIYSATTMAPLLVCGLKCQEQLAGHSCDPLTGCLWQWGCWWGSTILNFGQGDGNLARFLRAGPAPWPFLSLRIQCSPISCIWGKSM